MHYVFGKNYLGPLPKIKKGYGASGQLCFTPLLIENEGIILLVRRMEDSTSVKKINHFDKLLNHPYLPHGLQ
jgi:hypothetical protein